MSTEGSHIDDRSDTGRAAAWSRQLSEAHRALRQQLHDAQADLDSVEAGSGLLAHCLTFCTALTARHQGEERAISDAIDDQVQDTGWTTAAFEFRT